MALAFDSALNTTLASGTNSFSFTNTAGNIVFIGIATNGDGQPITAITYGGTSMTKVSNTPIFIVSGESIYVYYLQNAPTGSNSFSITTSAHTVTWGVSAASYSGAATSGFPDALSFNTGSGSPSQGTVTPVASNAWVVGFFRNIDANYSAGTATTQRGTAASYGFFDTNGTASGSTTLQATYSGSRQWGVCIFSIAPGASTFTKNLTESVTNTDSFIYSLTRSLTESITNSDTVIAGRLKLQSLIEAITNSDVLRAVRNGSLWTHISKSTASTWTKATKHSSTWTKATKNSSLWTHISKS